jgi:hypothetical protein
MLPRFTWDGFRSGGCFSFIPAVTNQQPPFKTGQVAAGMRRKTMAKKLTRHQWYDLETQFLKTPGLSDSFAASGEHFQLAWLLNTFGIRTNSRAELMKVAERLLVQGWENET